jgi:prepilin-type N-terminal cleavage/methylation domain-containing protein
MFEWKMPEARDGEKGFTLIEMSIVLVIIGLIIGGVLKGQELIGSTRLKGVITQVDAYKASMNGFLDKFAALPGDYASCQTSLAAAGCADGDNSGVIGTALATANAFSTAANTGENLNGWAHLAVAGLISGVTIGATANTAQVAASGGVPAGKISGSTFAMFSGTVNSVTAVWARVQSGVGTPTDAMTGKEAAEIDRKFDDSSSNTGSVMGGNVGATNCMVTTANNYNALLTSKACTLIFNLQ